MILHKLRNAIERRATLRDPDEGLWDALAGGRETLAGVRMSPATAMSLPAYYAAVRAISEDCAKLPLHHLKRLVPRGKERMRSRLDTLLNKQPNPDMTAMSWRSTVYQHAMGWGNHYSEIQRTVGGEPFWIWPLDPTTVRIDRNALGQLIYVHTPVQGGQRVLSSRDVFHLHGLGFDGVGGYAVARMARDTLGLAKAQEDSMASLCGKSMRPSGMFSMGEGTMKPETHKSLREQLQTVYGGSQNVGKAIIAEQSMTWQPFPMSMKDSEFIAGCHFSVEQFCRLLRIQPHKIFHLLRATYSNITEQSMEYVTDTLDPWLTYFEQEVERKLIPSNAPTEFAEHLLDKLLRGKPQERNVAYSLQRRNGIINPNEWREKENLNPIPGDAGETYAVQGTFMALDDIGKEPEPEPAPAPPTEPEAPPEKPKEEEKPEEKSSRRPADVIDELAAAQLVLLTEAYGRSLRVEFDKVKRRNGAARSRDWLDEFYGDHAAVVEKHLRPIVWTFARSAWAAVGEGEYPARVHVAVEDYMPSVVAAHVTQSRKEIAEAGNVCVERKVNIEPLAALLKDLCGAIETEN